MVHFVFVVLFSDTLLLVVFLQCEGDRHAYIDLYIVSSRAETESKNDYDLF